MKSVLLRAPVLTQSGYGVHARQVAKFLLSKNVDLSVQALQWGDTPWIINPDSHDGLIGKLMQKTDVPNKTFDVTVQLQLPNEWDAKLGKFNIGMTAAVETDRCNPEWINCCNKMDLVIVPSQHAKDSLTNTGKVTTRLEIIPESFPECFNNGVQDSKELDFKFATKNNFLLFGQITGNNPDNDRKNIFFTLKWFCEEFKNDPDVGLIVKTNAGRLSKIDKKIVLGIFNQVISEVRKTAYPKIYLLHGEMKEEELKSLYNDPTVKASISLSRGEGFGLPVLEAAAAGLPIIATDWSGYLDFLKLGKFLEVDKTIKEIHDSRIDNRIFMKGAKWAAPSEEHFKKRIRKFKDNSSIPKEWALDLQKKILQNYNFESIAKLYDNLLKDIL
jgi:glycosyltransferase involved in cell wall biosynthesis